MQLVDSKPTPDDRHVCVIWLSRAGLAIGADGQPVEAESPPPPLPRRLPRSTSAPDSSRTSGAAAGADSR